MPASASSNRSICSRWRCSTTQSGAVVDFPDDRTLVRAKQTLYSGLAFRPRRQALYASMASLTDPLANGKDATATVSSCTASPPEKFAPERLIPLPSSSSPPAKRPSCRRIGHRQGRSLSCCHCGFASAARKAPGRRQPLRRCSAPRCPKRQNETRFDLAKATPCPPPIHSPGALQRQHARYVAL